MIVSERSPRHPGNDGTAVATPNLSSGDSPPGRRAIEDLVAALVEPRPPSELIAHAAAALSVLGVIGGALIVANDAGEPLTMVTTGASTTIMGRLGITVIDGAFPTMAALRSGAALWLGTPKEIERRFPEFAAITGRKAFAALPLRSGDRLVGSVAFPFDRPQPFDQSIRFYVEAVAEILAAALAGNSRHSNVESSSAFLLDMMLDGALILDHRANCIAYANDAARRLLGATSPGDLDGTLADITARYQLRNQEAPRLLDNGRSAVITSLRALDGTQRIIRLHASALDEHLRQLVVLIDNDDDSVVVETQSDLDLRDAVLEDRKRMARDLHDGAIQSVFATSLSLAALALESPEPLRQRIEAAIDGLDNVVYQLRSTVFDLRRRSITGPVARLKGIVQAFVEASGIEPRLTIDRGFQDMAETAECFDHLEFALREALSNVARHAHATAVHVALRVGPESLGFSVHDNGAGFSADVPAGDGLANLRQRAESLGGDCRWDSKPGVGTTVQWSIRCAPRDPARLAHDIAS